MEVDEETRDFVTIQKKDFRFRHVERSKEYKPLPHYPPPLNNLNGAYQKCLNTRQKNVSLPSNNQSEDPQEFLNRTRDKYPRLKKVFPEAVPDENLIEKQENAAAISVYQSHYCKDIDDCALHQMRLLGRRKGIVALPSDCIIPETIQRNSYRNPWEFGMENLLRAKRMKKPPDNLTPSLKERTILCIRTGDTEYNATIDATGIRITEECSMRIQLPLESQEYINKENSLKSECSEVLKSEKLMLPNNIF